MEKTGKIMVVLMLVSFAIACTPPKKDIPTTENKTVAQAFDKNASLAIYKNDTLNWETALKAKDSSYCQKIIDGMRKNSCFFELARDLKDVSLCAPITEQRDACYLKVASVKKDGRVCLLAEEQASKDLCLRNVAEENLQGELCMDIADVSEKNNCYWNIATKTDNAELCSKIDVEVRCLPAGIEYQCNRMTGQKDSCFRAIAYALKNRSICDFMESLPERGACKEKTK